MNNGFFLFFFYCIFSLSPSLDTENELQKSHFDHKNLVYVNYLYVEVLFVFHEIEFNSHVHKIYFEAHINDNNESDLDLDNLN